MLKKKLGIEAIEMKRDLISYFKIPSTLIISEECKWIGRDTFSECRKLKEVIIPKSVKWIGVCAFRGCEEATIILKKSKSEFELVKMLLRIVKMLKKRLGIEGIERDWPNENENFKDYFKVSLTLTIPEGCRRVGNCTLFECDRLEKVSIPKSVWKIEDSAFEGCERLKKVEIPGSVESIGNWAFVRCNDLREVVISEGVKWIGSNVFAGCKELKKVVIPESCERIGNCAFYKCERATIILKKPRSEFEVEYNAFAGCEYVKEEVRS